MITNQRFTLEGPLFLVRHWVLLLLAMLLVLPLVYGRTAVSETPFSNAPSASISGTVDPDAHKVAACQRDAASGLFEPFCFKAAGSGDSLVSAWDAAFNAAAAYVASKTLNPQGTGATVRWRGRYNICNSQHGITLPQSGWGEGPGVDLVGEGPGSQLSLVCHIHRTDLPTGALPGSPLSDAAIWMPVQAKAHYTMYNWHDFTLYANGNSSSCMDMEGMIHVSQFTNLILGGAGGDGSAMSHCLRWGNAAYEQATANQVELHNVSVTPGGNGGGAGFIAETTLVGGVPRVQITDGGHDYGSQVALYLVGPPTKVDPRTGVTAPCTHMGTVVATVVSGAVREVALHGVSGCASGTALRAFDPVFPVNYGVWLDSFTDSPYIQMNPQTGRMAAVYAGERTGNNHYQAVHTCCLMPTGFVELGQGDSFVAFYADGPGQRAMSFGRHASASVQASKLYWNAVAKMTAAQAGAYSFGDDVGPITIAGGTCNGTGLQNHGGYAHVVSAAGINVYPPNLVIVADRDCGSDKPFMHQP